MVAPRGKKKKINKRVLIAIGAAVFLAMILVFIFKMSNSQIGQVAQSLSAIQAENQKLKQELEQQKEADRLQQRLNQQNQASTEIAPVKNTLSVVVAKRPIEAGTRLSSVDLESKEWPQDAVPVNASNYPEQLIGRITSSDIASGEPILPNKLIDKDTETLAIAPGFRAMTLPIDNITGVGGFITPGARVDLLTVVPKNLDKETKTDEKVSKILMQNVKVLATSGKPDPKGAKKTGDSSGGSSTVTIAVPAEEAVKLVLAMNNGDGAIQIILRGFQDDATISKKAIDTGELITGQMLQDQLKVPDIQLPRPPGETNYSAGANLNLNNILSNYDALPPPLPPTAQTKTHSIEIIEARSRQEQSFETEI